jgi:SOS-response transcriptional repressor LexA
VILVILFLFFGIILAEQNIKKEIGRRIFEARKVKGLTLKALGELAGGLKQTRLTNWEQGTRTPGSEGIKQLAQVLDVSPAFLMCLSDEKQVKKARNPSYLIPLLDPHQACNAKLYIKATREQNLSNNIVFISVSAALLSELSNEAFALKVADESMTPEIRINDVLVIDPSISPQPGDYVVVKVADKPETIICQYRKLSYTSPEFGLLTLNSNWPDIKVADEVNVAIIGKIAQNIRCYF